MNINKLILTSIVGITAVTGAFAEEKLGDKEALDYQTVTSRKYVDVKLGEKQNNIAVTENDFVYDEDDNPAADGSLVETTDKVGVVGQRGIFKGGEYSVNKHAAWVPTMGAMMAQITASAYTPPTTMTWTTEGTNNDPDALENYMTTFGDALHQWPDGQADDVVTGDVLAKSLALKQNKLEANDTTTYPNGSLVKYGTAAGIPEHAKIVTSVTNYDTDIATSKAVKTAITPVTWSAHSNSVNDEDAVKAYSVDFIKNTVGDWPTADKDKLVDTEALAKGLALKQNKKTCAEWAVQNPSTGVYTSYTDAATARTEAAALGTSPNCWLWTFDGDEPVAQASQSGNG